MSFKISDITANLLKGGARPSLFEVNIYGGANVNGELAVGRFLIKATSMPSSTIGTIQVPYFGRFAKVAGNRVFAPWSVTVINDETFNVRNALENWSNAINEHRGNVRYGEARSAPISYKAQATVTQYAQDSGMPRVYKFHGLYPTELSELDLSWEAVDQIEEFGCVFEYDYWTVEGPTSDTNSPGALD